MRSFWIAFLVGTSLIASSCAKGHSEKERTSTIVRLVPDSVPLEQTPTVTRFSITVIVRNDGHGPIVFGGCGPEAQRNIDGQWQIIWTPICGSPQYASISPGDSL